ncbi:MAG: DUF378 domain-containing protein [Patescibacteria group bacterium]
MSGKCSHSRIAGTLVLIGAINWGLIGLGYFFGGNWNVVNLLLGNWMWLEAVVYILVGVAGVIRLFGCVCKDHKMAEGGAPMGGGQM